jgi:hypothetical protein
VSVVCVVHADEVSDTSKAIDASGVSVLRILFMVFGFVEKGGGCERAAVAGEFPGSRPSVCGRCTLRKTSELIQKPLNVSIASGSVEQVRVI